MCKIFLAVILLAFDTPLAGGAAMLLAARASFAIANAKRWRNPYITDGLVAMWDAEWNVGGGMHDANATKWIDLSGNGCNLTAPAQYSFGSYFCDMPKGNRFTGLLPSVLSAVTVEFVGCFTASYTSSTDCDLGIETGNRGLGTFFLSNVANSARDMMIATRSSNASSSTTYKIRGPYPANAVSAYVNALTAFSGSAKVSSGKDFDLYVNGRARNGNSSSYWNAGVTIPTKAIGVGSTGKTPIRLCCTRIYSRFFTAAEIAANYAVDRARFNLP